jgi:AcrR family transcriptional regulator
VPRKKQVTDAQIVRVARRVFLAHGTQVPVAAVAKELGVSAATLFVRMGTKKRLIAAALWPPDPAVLARLERGYVGGVAFAAELAEIVLDLARYAESEIPATFTLYAAGLRAKPARLRRGLAKWLAGAARQGAVEGDPRLTAEIVMGTLEARVLHAFLGRRVVPARETQAFVRGLVDMVLRGVDSQQTHGL